MIVIYPNNDITVDGEPRTWTDEEWARHGIQKVRASANPDRADHKRINRQEALIFPTTVRDGRTTRTERPRPEESIYGTRPHRIGADGQLQLQCSERTGCGHWKPATEFTPATYKANRWLSCCKPCVNQQAGLNRQAKAAARSKERIAIQMRMQQETEFSTAACMPQL